jgi:hypothetical protein
MKRITQLMGSLAIIGFASTAPAEAFQSAIYNL